MMGAFVVNYLLFLLHGELNAVRLTLLLLLLLLKLPGQRVHLQLLPQANLLQAVVEVGLRAAAGGGRQSEDTHDLPLVFSGVHEQAEADQDHQQVNISGLIPGFVHRIIDRLRLVPQNPVATHRNYDSYDQIPWINISLKRETDSN